MMSATFPVDGASRKAILILSEHDYEKCSYTLGAGNAFLDQEACVLAYPVSQANDGHAAIRNIEDSGLLRPGVILVQSPYDLDTYEDALEAPHRFALMKHMYFSQLCKHLGATEVEVKQISVINGHTTHSLKLDGEHNEVGAGLSVERKDLNKLKSQMHLHDKFSGAPADILKAENFLRDARLWNDITLRTLLEMRRDGANIMQERTLILSLSNEAKRNISVAARINVPGIVLSADYRSETAQQHEYQLTVKIKF